MSTTLHTSTSADHRTTPTTIDVWWLSAAAAVVAAIALASIFAPDMVTGSQQETLPLPGLINWMWGGVALGYIAFLRHDACSPTVSLTIIALWTAVAATSIFAPELVTGSDPTRIPLAALIAPVIGALGTGFLCLHGLRQQLDL